MNSHTKFDVILIGSGMGSLSAAGFLATEGKNVLVIEKHDKPGGYLASFTRNNMNFDNGIFHLNEMGKNQTIPQFIRYWGGNIRSKKVYYKIKYFIKNKEFLIDSKNIQNDFIKYFPSEESEINKFFSITAKIIDETLSIGPPKPPYDMNIFEKIIFGIKAVFKMPTFMKYASKPGPKILNKLMTNKTLANLIFAYYPIHSMVFMGHAYGWEMLRRAENYYPEGGMRAIPDATVKAIQEKNGIIKFNTEVIRILIENGKALGVECADGTKFYSDIVISNSPIHHTLFKLLDKVPLFDKMREKIKMRDIFPSVMINYLGIDKEYDFEGINFFIFLDKNLIDIPEYDLTPYNCPLFLIVYPRSEDQTDYSVLLPAFLPYEYKDSWLTHSTKIRGEEYRKLKDKVKEILLNRVCEKLGEKFRSAIKCILPATPLTLERYTYNEQGAFMGWKMDSKHYGKFLSHTTPIENLYLVGQWVFPGGGVPAVMASGYYLAKKILKKVNIDLESKLKNSRK